MLGYRAGWITATLLITALLSPSAEAVDWVQRHIAETSNTTPAFRNVDVMILPDGTPAVGYLDWEVLTPTVGFVEGQIVRDITANLPSHVVSFKADPFGIISYTGFGPDVYGTDYGQRQTLNAAQRPEFFPSSAGRASELVLDSRSIPTVVSRSFSSPNTYQINTFDVISASWNASTLPSSISLLPGVDPLFSTAAAFLPDDRLVVASYNYQEFEVAIEQPTGDFFTIATDAFGSTRLAASVTTSHTGEVAFALRQDNDLKVGIYDGVSVSYETIATGVNPASPIALGSLAYAPDGTLGLAYIDGFQGDVMYATRTAPNTWTHETLPIEGVLASLTYDAASNPFIGVAADWSIELLSPVLEPLFDPILGDYDNNGEVGQSDLDLVLANWGVGFQPGPGELGPDWVNQLGITGPIVGQDELALVLQNWGNTASPSASAIADATGLSESQIESLVPEPTSLTLLIIGGSLTLRRPSSKDRLQPAGDARTA